MTDKPPRTHYYVAGARVACGKSFDEVDKFTEAGQSVTCRSCMLYLGKLKRDEVRRMAREKLALWKG